MSTFIKVLNSTNSTSKSLNGRLKELTNKAKDFLVISKSGRSRLRELLINNTRAGRLREQSQGELQLY